MSPAPVDGYGKPITAIDPGGHASGVTRGPDGHDLPAAEAKRPGGTFRLLGKGRKAVLTAHILASVGWFGVALMVAFCAIAAAVTGDLTFSHALYRTIQVSPWLSIPIGVAAVATGTLLGLGTSFGLIRHWWVVAKMAIALAVIITDAVLVVGVAHDAAISGHAASPLYGSTIAHIVVLALATVLSVFKPRGRTPYGRRAMGGSPPAEPPRGLRLGRRRRRAQPRRVQ